MNGEFRIAPGGYVIRFLPNEPKGTVLVKDGVISRPVWRDGLYQICLWIAKVE